MIRRHRWHVLGIVVALAVGAILAAATIKASADATENYPIPRKMLTSTCTAEQIMAGARDVSPIYNARS